MGSEGKTMSYTIITHDRKAHMDEVLAAALVALHREELPQRIERIPPREAARRTERLTSEDYSQENLWFLDCGMQLDPARNLYDHHQDRETDSTALLIFNQFFSHLQETELHHYMKLVSRVDTRGAQTLDDFESLSESRSYWSFPQKMILRLFEDRPRDILELFVEGLRDKISFEEKKQKAREWLYRPGHIEIVPVAPGLKALAYRRRPPSELVSALRSADSDIIDREDIYAVYSFDEENPETRILFRTNRGHEALDFTRAEPQKPLFCHAGGFLLKFIPQEENEWLSLSKKSFLG